MVTNVSAGDWIGAPPMRNWDVESLILMQQHGGKAEIERRAKAGNLTDAEKAMVHNAGIALQLVTQSKIQEN